MHIVRVAFREATRRQTRRVRSDSEMDLKWV
jgi:hypothetical protein